ncbi:astacin, partial [Ostertagia ostertagi]
LRKRRNAAIIGKKFRWPNAVVPYEFKDNNTEWKKLIWRGMKQWQRETCIRFVERTNETDYAVFFKGGGCYSSVGRTGGRQYISIGWGCESGNFEKRSDIMDSEIPYDFGSVMHYAPQAFTKNWKLVTVETKDHRFQHTIGQRGDVSFTDVKHANSLYCRREFYITINIHEATHCHSTTRSPKKNKKFRGRIMSVVRNYGVKMGAMKILETAPDVNARPGLVELVANELLIPHAPPGGRISFETVSTNFVCDSSCSENYLEIKHAKKLEQTGFRQCCNPAAGRTVSDGNQVIVSSVSKTAPSNFTLRYILDSESIPPPPSAAWKGDDGLTGLFGANEVGIDNTFESIILKKLPQVLGRSRGGPNVASLFGLLDTFLPKG